jgi:hypothetical protein
MSVNIAEESAPQFRSLRTPQCEEGKRMVRGTGPRDAVGSCTVCLRSKHGVCARGRSPDSQVIALPATFPFPKNSGLLSRPLAAHSGGTVRDSHPLPFSLASRRAPQGFFTLTHDSLAGQWPLGLLSVSGCAPRGVGKRRCKRCAAGLLRRLNCQLCPSGNLGPEGR